MSVDFVRFSATDGLELQGWLSNQLFRLEDTAYDFSLHLADQQNLLPFEGTERIESHGRVRIWGRYANKSEIDELDGVFRRTVIIEQVELLS